MGDIGPQWTANYLRYGAEGSATFDSFEAAVSCLYNRGWEGEVSSVSIVAPDGTTAWDRSSSENLKALAERLGVEDW